MARQSAAFHPLSYALWYEHVAGMNPGLSQILEKKLAANLPLTEDEAYRLHAQHIVARDINALERLQEQLRTLLAETARTAATAGAEAGQFGSALEQHKAQLNDSMGSDRVSSVVAELLNETVRMQAATQALSQKLEASSNEVNTLTDRLERAQTEALLDPLDRAQEPARPRACRRRHVRTDAEACRNCAADGGHRLFQEDQRHLRASAWG